MLAYCTKVLTYRLLGRARGLLMCRYIKDLGYYLLGSYINWTRPFSIIGMYGDFFIQIIIAYCKSKQ